MSTPPEPPPLPPAAPVVVDYASLKAKRGPGFWTRRFISRLSKPMPLGMLYLIMTVLGLIVMLIAMLVGTIVHALRH